jgi:Damage-control phosphatase ARMT1-like domain
MFSLENHAKLLSMLFESHYRGVSRMKLLRNRHPNSYWVVFIFLGVFVLSWDCSFKSFAWKSGTCHRYSNFLGHRSVSMSSIRRTMVSTEIGVTESYSTSSVLPNLPLPPKICSDVVGTWAHDTMSRRVYQEILCNIVLKDCADDLAQAHFLPIRDAIISLRTELQFAATTPLTALSLPPIDDVDPQQRKEWEEWDNILAPYLENKDTWLSAPWLVTEFYVYRRLMQCFDYWNLQSAGYMYDPFITQKRNGLLSSTGNAEPALTKLQVLLEQLNQSDAEDGTVVRAGLLLATQLSLWGNKMDLSLWPADVNAASTDVFSSILEQASTNLLHDDSNQLSEYCCQILRTRNRSSPSKTNVDIIVDNAGFELVTDLALAQYLIESGIAGTVTFQMKSHPTFVSDALEKDLLETVEYYERLDPNQFPACVRAGQQWRKMLNSGQWVCVEHSFWVQPLAMWDMYEPLRSELNSRCNLAFVKGDANYRRLLGDRMWDLSAPFEDVVGCYFPVPVCALRTLKAELGCGMERDQVERAQSLDPNWMTNGRFGVVHFGRGSSWNANSQ